MDPTGEWEDQEQNSRKRKQSGDDTKDYKKRKQSGDDTKDYKKQSKGLFSYEEWEKFAVQYQSFDVSYVPPWDETATDGLRKLKISFGRDNELEIHDITMPNKSTIADLLDELSKKVKLSHPNAELRLLEEFSHTIYKIFRSTEKIGSIYTGYGTLRAEEIPEEEKNLGPRDCLIHVYHFMNQEYKNQLRIVNFGEPFMMVIHEDENLAQIKNRVQEKLQVPDEEFSKWKFAFISKGQAEYLEDSDVMFSRFQSPEICHVYREVTIMMLGSSILDCSTKDNSPKRSLAVNQDPVEET